MVCGESDGERDTDQQHRVQERLREGRIKRISKENYYKTSDSYSNRFVWSDLDTVNIVNCAVSELFDFISYKSVAVAVRCLVVVLLY